MTESPTGYSVPGAMDGIVFKDRENSKFVNKTVYLVIGYNRECR